MQELKIAHDFIVDLWQYMKSHYFIEDSEKYWESVISDGNDLLKKYHETEHYDFYKKLVFACIDNWEDQRKRKERVN